MNCVTALKWILYNSLIPDDHALFVAYIPYHCFFIDIGPRPGAAEILKHKSEETFICPITEIILVDVKHFRESNLSLDCVDVHFCV